MNWCRPAYGARSFDLLPGTIERALTGATHRPALAPGLLNGLDGRFDRVAFVYLDAFGWLFAERYADHPLLARARSDGLLVQLTSQFPSTTAAHVTTIHSGQPVGTHGVYEWYIYEPLLDRMISPLVYSFAGDRHRGTLSLPPSDVFPAETLYDDLAAAGIRSHVVHPAVHSATPPNQILLRGAASHPFAAAEEGLALLASALVDPGYGMIYLDELDSLMHDVGPDDASVVAEMERMLTLIEHGLALLPQGTLVLLSADHGMSPVSAETTVYVNLAWPEIGEHLAHGADGKPLAPGGSCRDLFLHVLPDRIPEVVGRLGDLLEGRAEVQAVAVLLDDGLFGAEPSDRLRARLGNVLVLPFHGESVYWFEAGRFEQKLTGQHGGLTPQEMEIPLLAFVV